MSKVFGLYREYPKSEIFESSFDYSNNTIGPFTCTPLFEYWENSMKEYADIPKHLYLKALYDYEGLAAFNCNNCYIVVINQKGLIYISVYGEAMRMADLPIDYSNRYSVEYNGYKLTKAITKKISMSLYQIPGKGKLPPLSTYLDLVANKKGYTGVITNEKGELEWIF